jgi:hypothetical protein
MKLCKPRGHILLPLGWTAAGVAFGGFLTGFTAQGNALRIFVFTSSVGLFLASVACIIGASLRNRDREDTLGQVIRDFEVHLEVVTTDIEP